MFIIDWWNSLSTALQVFYCIAIPSTLLLLIQTIMMFVGISDDGMGDGDGADINTDADIDPDNPAEFSDPDGLTGLRIFTIRGLIAFFVVFGWVGIVMLGAACPIYITIPIAAVCGFAMMVLLAYLFKVVLKLRSDGNADNKNAIGTSGKVHLTIPPCRTGEGKVHLMLQGSYVERNAVTDSEAAIPTGAEVVVIGISGQTDLVVKLK